MSNAFGVSQLTDRIWAIEEVGFVRSYLIVGDERALLIDSCSVTGTALAQAVKVLTDLPVTLVITHSDYDHTGGQEGFGTPLMHPSEFSLYYAAGNTVREVLPIWEGDVIELGNASIEVILTPGHTPGSIALLFQQGRRLFTGDTIPTRQAWMFGEGRDLRAYLASLIKLENMSERFDVICPSHREAEIGVEWITRVRIATEKYLAGELEGEDSGMNIPAKAYVYDGITLLC